MEERRRINPVCILCNASDVEGNNGEQNCSKNFIKLLSKFLKIRSKFEENDNSDISTEFVTCDDCFVLGKSFCDLYSQWECLELQLEWKIREVFNIVSHADNTTSASDEDEVDMDDDSNVIISSEVKCLREEIWKSCKNKLNSCFPKIMLQKIPDEEEDNEKQAERTILIEKIIKKKPPSTLKVVDVEKNLREKFKCRKCQKTFQEEIWLNVHLQVHHSALCRQKHDEHHIDNSINDANDSSIDPDAETATEKNSVSQSNSIPPAIPRSSNCHVCGFNFDSQLLLTLHLRDVHQIQTPFECPLCGNRKKCVGQFRAHMKLVHNTVSGLPGSFKCPKCEERYTKKAGLKIHLAKAHQFHSNLNRMHSTDKGFPQNIKQLEQRLSANIIHLKRHGNRWRCKSVTNKNQQELETEGPSTSGNHSRYNYTELEMTDENQQQNETQTHPQPPVETETRASTLDSSGSKDRQMVERDPLPFSSWKCAICQACFSSGVQLTAHMKRKHNQPPRVKLKSTPCAKETETFEDFLSELLN